MDVKSSLTLKYDLPCLDFLIKISSESHALLESMPLFAVVGIILHIFLICLRRHLLDKWQLNN